MSEILLIGAAAVVAIILWTKSQEDKQPGSPQGGPPGDTPDAPIAYTPLNPNGGLNPPGCTPSTVHGAVPGMWDCPNIFYPPGNNGIVISSFRLPAYDPVDPQISIAGDINKYYFRQWLPNPPQ